MSGLAITIVLTACMGGNVQGELVLEGPVRVEVDRLGPVDGPVAIVEGIDDAAAVRMSVEPESVAHFEQGELHAIGPGEAVVRASWKEQTVEWTLVVEPGMTLEWDKPPSSLAVGQTHNFTVFARSGDARSDAGALVWTSSAPTIASVSESGAVTGVAPGMVYISAKAARAEAMIELKVE